MNLFIYFYLVWIFIFLIDRIYLLVSSGLANLPLNLLLNAFFIGFRFDIVICSYILAPIILILPLLEKTFIKESIIKKIVYYYFNIVSFILFFFLIMEIFYFKEYGQRYNHLAVEYLKYPREVFTNIFQYYPVITVTIIILITYYFISLLLKKIVFSSSFFRLNFLKRLVLWFCFICILFIGCRNSFQHRAINIALSYFSKYQALNEISLNGFFSFGYAFIDKLKNEVDYKKRYLSLNDEDAYKIVRNIISNKNTSFTNNTDILRNISPVNADQKKYNVVIILEESLGAEFTGILGIEKYKKLNLTPNIDKLAENSILFTNAYSTGTRTARGIEGTVSSFPPIPGESIIKRSKTVNNFFTIGRLLKSYGYATHFIYGGQAMFDNMRGFFNSNGFDNIIEENDFINPTFKTTWGVCDEDLFNKADEIFKKQTNPFLAVLISTSNHMPFLLPENKIEKLPNNIEDYDRLNAVRYSDLAVGNFIQTASKSEYFKNTLFVIVADHGTRVYGQDVIPVNKFHIPLLFYAPEILKNYPKTINTITSQIDIAPTILSVLNIPYKTTFFGRNIFDLKENQGLALFQYDKLLGMLDNENLTVLYPDKTYKIFKNSFSEKLVLQKNFYGSPLFSSEKICASYFQTADNIYNAGKYNYLLK